MIKSLLDITGYDLDENRRQAAAEKGCRCVFPEPNELQIDIDSEEGYEIFQNVVSVFPRGGSVEIVDIEEHPSLSGLPNRHITITLSKEFNVLERIAFQFLFGSDRIRESISLLREILDIEEPICFFEPKKKYRKILDNLLK